MELMDGVMEDILSLIHICIRRVTLCRHPCGKHLLYEGHAAGVGQAHAGRTGDEMCIRDRLRPVTTLDSASEKP